MTIFNSYVKLPEGTFPHFQGIHGLSLANKGRTDVPKKNMTVEGT